MGRLLFTRHGRSQEIKDPLSLKLKGLEVISCAELRLLRVSGFYESAAKVNPCITPLKQKKKPVPLHMFYFIDCFSLSARRVPDDNKSRPLCCFLEHFGANAPTEAVGRYLPPRPHQASHKQSAVLPTVPRVFPSPSQRHASLRSVHWHGVQLLGLSFKSTCFSPLISHPSQRLTASPRPPLIYPSAGTRWTSVHLLHRFCPPFDTHTHTPRLFFFSFLPLSLFLILP